jgi:hypothetical protein
MGALLVAFISCFVQPVAAQEYRGTVRGVVTDPTHAVVPGAKVTLLNINTNVERTVRTDSGGFYLFDFVIPGTYRVTVEAAGFQKYVQENVIVQVKGDVTVDAMLALGAVTQTVDVTTAVTQVEFNTSTISTTLSNTNLKELPMLGLSPWTMALLDPATVDQYWDTTHRYPYYMMAAGETDVGGPTASKVELLLDGTSVNVSERGSYTPPMDAVQEMVVQKNTTDAEYGFSAGATFNLSLKSGTNAVHGSAYDYGRNPDTDALANRIDRSPSIYRQNSWGGTIGHPIIKNKLFNFFSYEQWIFTNPNSREETMPTAAEKTGDFSQALTPEGAMRVIYDPTSTVFNPVTDTVARTPISCNGVANVICPNRIDPTAALLMPYIWGPNATPDDPSGLNNLKVTYAWWTHYWNISDRGDWNINDHWRFFARFSKYQTRLDNSNWSDNDSIGVPSDNGGIMDALNGAADMLWMVTPRTTVDFRYGATYTEDDYNSTIYKLKMKVACTGAPNQNCNAWQYLWPNNSWYQNVLSPPQGIYFPPFSWSGIGSAGTGVGSWWQCHERQHNPVVNVLHEAGKHQLKFGWELRYGYAEDYALDGDGALNFNAVDTGSTFLSNFNPAESGDMWASSLLGVVDSGVATIEPYINIQTQQWAFYAQDDYKLNGRVTLNLGLRWERELAPNEAHNELVRTMDMTQAIPQLQGMTIWGPQQLAALPANAASLQNMVYSFTGAMVRVGPGHSRMFDTPWTNFLPRAGIAIRLNDKTALRMGYGRYMAPWQTMYYESLFLPLNGYSQVTSNLGPLEGLPRSYVSDPFPTGGAYPNPVQLPAGSSLGPYQDLGNAIGGTYSSPGFPNSADMKTQMNDRFNFTLQRQEPSQILAAATFYMMFSHQLQPMLQSNYYNIDQMDPMLAYEYKGLTAESVPNPFYNLLPANIMPGMLRTEQTVPLSQLLIPYPQYLGLTQMAWPGYSDHYYGLSLSANRPMFKGYTFMAAYNYSHEFASQYYNDIAYYNNNLQLFDRGLPRHTIRIYGTYELPFGKGRQFMSHAPKVVDAILGGWSTSQILWWRSGDLNMFGADQLVCNPTQNIPSGSWFNGNCLQVLPAYTIRTNPLYYEGLRGPKYWELDSTLVKTFKLTERVSLEFRAEAYNLTNSFMPSDPDTTPQDGTTGLSTWVATGNYGRQMQFNLHLSF